MNKKVYHKWLARILKELYSLDKEKEQSKEVVEFRLEELKRCLKEAILLDFKYESR